MISSPLFLMVVGCVRIALEEPADCSGPPAATDTSSSIPTTDTGTTCELEEWFEDADDDGFGDDAVSVEACTQPSGYTEESGDCDDDDDDVNPDAYEPCGGEDLNCDGEVEECPSTVFLGLADMDVTLPGDLAGDEMGSAVGIGDVTADGLPDVLVGARYALDAGAVWLHPGPLTEPQLTTGAALARFTAASAGELGVDNCVGDDLDGDGVGDLVVGSRKAGEDDEGRVWLLYGPLSGLLTETNADGRFDGTATDDLTGVDLSCGGDIDGDGRVDLLIGARGLGRMMDDGNELEESGAAFVVTEPITGAVGPEVAVTIWGERRGQRVGRAVDSSSDLDGDGLADIALGAYFDSTHGDLAGLVYIVEGGITDDLYLEDADARLFYDEEGAAVGRDVATAGDIDCDGLGDLVIGAPGASSAAGAAFVVTQTPSTDIDLADAALIILGGDPDGYLGYAVGSDGDTNADGLADARVSAPGQHGAPTDSSLPGVLGIFYGGAGTRALAEADVVIEGGGAGESVGYDASLAGDLNGDQVDDLLMGATFAAGNADGSGAAFVLFSSLD